MPTTKREFRNMVLEQFTKVPRIMFGNSADGRRVGVDAGGPIRDVASTVIKQELERPNELFTKLGSKFFLHDQQLREISISARLFAELVWSHPFGERGKTKDNFQKTNTTELLR
ncbi:hypothetical protein K440DRAFT_643228 [Wilcoxina mikolae CBS 423.85]|nr:hypothetical protein K440DRAFT_643228 [Wilcoxina mikolae CBS 423.85]